MTIAEQIAAKGGLVNQGELARRWNLSAQRVNGLVCASDFPAPVGEVGGRPVWLFDEADEWREARMERFGKRKAGVDG